MRKTGIVGHRGAAGEALENTRDSLQKALEANVDAIEFDVRHTKDGKLILLHDRHTGRVSDRLLLASKSTLAELQKVILRNGEHPISLEDAFKIVGNKKPITIDVKDDGIGEIIRLSRLYPHSTIELTSTHYKRLRELHDQKSNWPVYVLDAFIPFGVIYRARRARAHGVGISKWLINPITYRLARRHGLEVRIYTVNSVRLARWFRSLYPEASIYTNRPKYLLAQLEL